MTGRLFPGRRGVDGKCVDTAGKLLGQNTVNQAMAFHPGLTFERARHDIDAEVALPSRAVAGMAFMQVGFVHHIDALGGESLGQLFCDQVCGPHTAQLEGGRARVNGREAVELTAMRHSQALKPSPALAHSVRS